MAKYLITNKNKEELSDLSKKLADEAAYSQAIVLNWDKDSSDVVDKYVEHERAYWHGYLLIRLINALKDRTWMSELVCKYLPSEAAPIFYSIEQIKTPENWAEEVRIHPESYHLLMDKIDEELERENQWVYAFYNDLELLPCDYVYALQRYWDIQSRRLRRICPRIFLLKEESLFLSLTRKQALCCRFLLRRTEKESQAQLRAKK